MSDTHAQTGANGDGDAVKAERRRTPWPLVVVALLFVVVPSLTWYLTWFGRGLTDEELTRYLSDSNPRQAQHALSQLAGRIEKGDERTARWNAQVAALSQSQTPDLRMTAAWVMGLEHKSEDFRAALARLLEDPEPIVRRNAALALVRFGDPRCRAELLAMLRPYAVKSASGGTALTALTEGTHVKRGSLLLKFKNQSGALEEVRSPLPGELARALVKDGEGFASGGDLFVLAPDAEQARDALVGLYYVGGAEDLAEVERYAGGVEGAPEDLKAKAAQVAEAIKRRSQDGR
ncbi:MAG TPA: HEAT repeat domain-containing protein [Pyrinomonadaceae bacterium]|nr:HEAT repeat domain-containing protein [Pyrinomonadaceae bacterium]